VFRIAVDVFGQGGQGARRVSEGDGFREKAEESMSFEDTRLDCDAVGHRRSGFLES
jgi:hypothetical protein